MSPLSNQLMFDFVVAVSQVASGCVAASSLTQKHVIAWMHESLMQHNQQKKLQACR